MKSNLLHQVNHSVRTRCSLWLVGSESGKPCEVCALIRDSVETFFRGSGLLSKKHLAKLDADSLKYQVEIKNLAGKKKARDEDAPKAPSRLLLGVMCELDKGREEFELEIYAVPGGTRSPYHSPYSQPLAHVSPAKVPPFLAKFGNAKEVLLNPTPEEYATTITKCCKRKELSTQQRPLAPVAKYTKWCHDRCTRGTPRS